MELEGIHAGNDKANTVSATRGPRRRNRADWGRAGIRHLLSLVVIGGLAYGGFQVCQRYVVQSVRIRGCSMSPTLPDADWYLLNRFVYHFREPQPEEIVVLQDPEDDGYAVKRIVAKPGDSVFVKNGYIFVNGKLLREAYLPPGTKTFTDPRYESQFWVCGVNQYFVLGDNRNNSTDSRFYGVVPQQRILGAVLP